MGGLRKFRVNPFMIASSIMPGGPALKCLNVSKFERKSYWNVSYVGVADFASQAYLFNVFRKIQFTFMIDSINIIRRKYDEGTRISHDVEWTRELNNSQYQVYFYSDRWLNLLKPLSNKSPCVTLEFPFRLDVCPLGFLIIYGGEIGRLLEQK